MITFPPAPPGLGVDGHTPGQPECLSHRALGRHVWIYTGLGAVTCQLPNVAFFRAGRALLGLDGSLFLFGGQPQTITCRQDSPWLLSTRQAAMVLLLRPVWALSSPLGQLLI